MSQASDLRIEPTNRPGAVTWPWPPRPVQVIAVEPGKIRVTPDILSAPIDRTPVPTHDSQPIPPSARKDLTIKQQRDVRRAEKVAALKAQQNREKRNRLIGIIVGSVAGVAALAMVVTLVVTSATPKPDPADVEIAGLETFEGVTNTHVATPVTYEQTPPVGGDHAAAWLNCGIYDQPVPNENAVHDLEHGAVWVTYDAEKVSGDDLEALRDSVPDTYITMSPFPDLPAPVVASAWGAQVQLDGVDDPRLQQFIDKFWKSEDAPEPGAACTGGVDAPGRVL